jgi:SAM-dependent methyltransferase
VSPGGSPEHWFEPVADHLGAAYLRYSFTKGTDQEVAFLVDALAIRPGDRLLDVGCGPGRHAHALGRLGIRVHGVDISQRFVDAASVGAPSGVTFERVDARRMDFVDEFDVAISLCQGAFGLVGAGPGTDTATNVIDPDGEVLAGMARAVRPGGRVAVSAFSSYFMVRFLEDHDSFDAARGVNHERTTVRSEAGEDLDVDLWTSCFTPRELRLLAHGCGLQVDHVWSVTPGGYERREPDLDHAEFLLVARRPG